MKSAVRRAPGRRTCSAPSKPPARQTAQHVREDAEVFIRALQSLGPNNGADHHARLCRERRLTLLPLIRKGEDFELIVTKGNTALHYACALGYYERAAWLVAHGADVDWRTDKGATPLQSIAPDPDGRIRRLLLEAGAEP